MVMLLFLFVGISLASSCQGNVPEVAAGKPQGLRRLHCLSWRVANEANNTVGWDTIPPACQYYVREYLLGGQYWRDSEFIINEAITYVRNVHLPRDGRNTWVFDIDETVLSNIGFFIHNGLAVKAQPAAPALPESKRLYKELLSLGIKIVFLTGRGVNNTDATIANLVAEGFDTWEKLILRSDEFESSTALEYKSTVRTRLEKERYRIIGNIGDQWSDISGPSPGRRMFKLPNPIYYLP